MHKPLAIIKNVMCIISCYLVLTCVTDDRHPSRPATLNRPLRTVENPKIFPVQNQPWERIPLNFLPRNVVPATLHLFSTSSRLPSRQPSSDKTPSSHGSSSKPTLTHLNQSGNAHMVSISSKEATKRTAIAVCSVQFSNPVAATLIRENRAKKGDVLGVARVAGIMAAKRTADLIPLCHPISITHVGVEVELRTGNIAGINTQETVEGALTRQSMPSAGTEQGDAYRWPSSSPIATAVNNASQPSVEERQAPRVDISATVSCEGKTGVEMEALTAASVAALTVYDMCKAVDKGMRIEGLRVVRKEGGKSGTWIEGYSVY